ncbi:MAG: phosphoribosylglycinamide formyltransferase [Rickettsiales bacterium]|nr:phosphoribosylglycinamide formyltransferase [Rickettsiales bacterium]
MANNQLSNNQKSKHKIVVLISGTGSNLKAIIEASLNNEINAEVVLVISNNPNAYGINHAKENNIPYAIINHKNFNNRRDFEIEIEKQLDHKHFDLICLAGFMRILTADFTKKYHGKMINIHPSLLPKFKGANAIEEAFNAQESETGCTIHYVIPEIDSGDIIIQKKISIDRNDDLNSLKKKIHQIEHIAYIEAINKIL